MHFLDTLKVAGQIRDHEKGKKAGPEGLRLLAVAGTLPPHDLEDALGCLKALEGVRATGATNMMHRKNLEQLAACAAPTPNPNPNDSEKEPT
jgi:hypothetical protein